MIRCPWCGTDPLYVAYHDQEWGVPVHDDRQLFELLILEGAQAGLSWITVLRKRDAYRKAFDDFDIDRVASYGEEDVARLLAAPGIVRNRLKVRGAIRTATAAQAMSKARRHMGATFVGPTICYAFRQAAGLVDDHVATCWKRTG